MRQVVLRRIESTDQGTIGTFSVSSLHMYTMELPWRDNKRQVSCVPYGQYICSPYTSAKYKDVYVLHDVPDRSAILIHIGNWAGDVEKGYKTNSQGCILLGSAIGVAKGQKAVLNSSTAIRRFREFIGKNTFQLTIIGGAQ